MNTRSTAPNAQEVLLTTVHNQNNVVEVYLNKLTQTVTELYHLSNHRVKVYEYEIEEYKQKPNSFGILDKI
ncbi:hypothetical protein OAD50_03750 [Vicingaceae bacterium]|nr:hypothetical protein [Vicingaceae bacterium]MDB9964165.1 hypothetical protein [Vicingaceae bacterium]